MRRREFIGLIGGTLLSPPRLASAQQAGRVPLVGYLWHTATAEEEQPYYGAAVDGFAKLGYIAGRNINITGEKFVGGLPFLHQAFNGVGWFIPPYIQSGLLHKLAGEIASRGEQYSQDDLEAALSRLYGAYDLAAMVMHRYTIAPVIRDYRETIAEAVEAHFFGLNHIAIGGLVPVIEGAGRRLALQRGLGPTNVREVFLSLAEDCKNESITKNIGATDEIVSMMDSFATFTSEYMYVGSQFYPLADRTNRHGITHGAYSDDDYGRPLNFYKVIAAIDFLTLVASFRANISWLGPSHTEQSLNLARYYAELAALAERRVR